MSDNPYEFNIKLLEALGLPPDKVASYMIVGDGDGVTINVEWVPDDWTLDMGNVIKRFRLVEIDPADGKVLET